MLFSVDKIRRLLPASVPQKKQARHRKSGALLVGGDEEDRTLDLTDANRTLSQLSYAPEYWVLNCLLFYKYSLVLSRIKFNK